MHLIGVALRFWNGGNRLASDVGTPLRHAPSRSSIYGNDECGGEIVKLILLAATIPVSSVRQLFY